MSTPTEFNGLCRISHDGKYLTEINSRAVTGTIMPGTRDIWRVMMAIQDLPDPRFTFTLLPVEPMPILIDDLLTLSPVVGPPLLPIPMLVEPGKPGPNERQLWKLDTMTVVKSKPMVFTAFIIPAECPGLSAATGEFSVEMPGPFSNVDAVPGHEPEANRLWQFEYLEV